MNKYHMKKFLALTVFLFLVLNSCATKALWERTDPGEYVRIEGSAITAEMLEERGAEYIYDAGNDIFYVEKDAFAKFRDYSSRVLATPVTLVVDATAVTVFALGYAIVTNAVKEARQKCCDEDPDCRNKRCPNF